MPATTPGRAALISLLNRLETSHSAHATCSAVRCSPPRTEPAWRHTMHAAESTVESKQSIARRASELFAQYRDDIHGRTDRLFAGLMAFQWLLGIIFALWVSPLAWEGPVSRTQPARVGRGRRGRRDQSVPGAPRRVPAGPPSTRYVIAVAQMLMGGASDPPDRRAASRRTSTCLARSPSWPSIATGGC